MSDHRKRGGSGAAVVTTFRAADAYLSGFAKYHLKIGFDRLYLFQDDLTEDVPSNILADPRVTIIPYDSRLQERWRAALPQHKGLPFLYTWREREVMARQLLNVAIAIDLAKQQDVRWLLSIDIDELFFCGEHLSVSQHFEALDRQGVLHSSYVNHELVPECWDVDDVFGKSTLFKLSPHVLRADQRAWFEHRFPKRIGYFNYYHWGKAAARVIDGLLPGFTVHEFLLADCPTQRPVLHSTPCILHYAIGGFAEFKQKYALLGRFGDHWFGSGVDIRKALPFHVAARDAVADNDPQTAVRFYRDNTLFSPAEVSDLLHRGICRRFVAPSQLLQGPHPPGPDSLLRDIGH